MSTVTAVVDRKDLLRLLRDGRCKIERGWCQGSYARNRLGEKLGSRSAEAESWCAVGAIFSQDPDVDLSDAAMAALLRAAGIRAGTHHAIPIWNDAPSRAKADVLAAYDAAIADLEAIGHD